MSEEQKFDRMKWEIDDENLFYAKYILVDVSRLTFVIGTWPSTLYDTMPGISYVFNSLYRK